MPDSADLEQQLQAVTQALVAELIHLTPQSMSDIQFEIVGTDDGGADLGLLDNHPDVQHVALSQSIHQSVARYLPLVREYVPGWKRSLLMLQEEDDGWKVQVVYETD